MGVNPGQAFGLAMSLVGLLLTMLNGRIEFVLFTAALAILSGWFVWGRRR